MSSGHDAGHGSNDPFDRVVALTMAIIAAALACVTMLSHGAHNDSLLAQGEANRLQTQSNIFHTKASDQWNYFQAKNIRFYQMQNAIGLYESFPKPAAAPAAAPAAKKGKKGAPAAEAAAEPASAPTPQVVEEWAAYVKKYEVELPKLQAEAEALVKKAEHKEEEAVQKVELGEKHHHRGARFDYGELLVELALILCSVAMLSKRKAFWYAGIVSSSLGAVVALSAFLISLSGPH
jgi:hypothetical protein